MVPFFSVDEYLTLLEFMCRSLSLFGARALVYLAAAVSDFYLPFDEISEHKIQSSASQGNHLTLELKPVPKRLKCLVEDWCPKAFVVSFKASVLHCRPFHESDECM